MEQWILWKCFWNLFDFRRIGRLVFTIGWPHCRRWFGIWAQRLSGCRQWHFFCQKISSPSNETIRTCRVQLKRAVLPNEREQGETNLWEKYGKAAITAISKLMTGAQLKSNNSNVNCCIKRKVVTYETISNKGRWVNNRNAGGLLSMRPRLSIFLLLFFILILFWRPLMPSGNAGETTQVNKSHIYISWVINE